MSPQAVDTALSTTRTGQHRSPATRRGVLYQLLGIVAVAAAVLSFSALRDLALVCGFAPMLAWLLPIVVDAGAAAGSLVWLGGRVGVAACRFARALALILLGLSVAANALGHGLAAFALAPAWWVVVLVSAIAPAVLGAVVHLAVLVGRPDTTELPNTCNDITARDEGVEVEPIPFELTAEAYTAGAVDEHGLSSRWDTAPPAAAHGPAGERVAALIAAGAGRRRLARELGITEHEARRLLADSRTTNVSSPAPPVASFDARPGAPLSNGVRS